MDTCIMSRARPRRRSLGPEHGARGEKPPRARRRGNREEAHDEHPVVGPAGPRRAPVRSVGRHGGLHVRQGKRGGPSFGALPREAWTALGILELVCMVGLIVPAAFHRPPALTVVAATVLAIESLVFVGVHVK